MNDSVMFLAFFVLKSWTPFYFEACVVFFYVVGVVTVFIYLSYNPKCMVLGSCDMHTFAGGIKK